MNDHRRSVIALSPLELATGRVFDDPRCGTGQLATVEDSPREALDRVLRRALARPPCVVAFSGGLDSSAVLAAATALARREGLAVPIAVSLHFPGVTSTDEDAWQELVIDTLKVPDWERVPISGELDFLGVHAQRALSRHGLLWPANSHFLTPVLARAGGGTVLTGLDGDGLFGGWRWQRAWSLAAGHSRPQPRDPARLLFAAAPVGVRRLWLSHRAAGAVASSWLTPAGVHEMAQRLGAEQARVPRRWDRRVQDYAHRRYLQVAMAGIALIGADHDVEVGHPFTDPGFLFALARDGGASGYGDRRSAMRRLFGDVLPEALLARRSKAEFGRALWGPAARSYGENCDGTGLDPALVDLDRLLAVWRRDNPPLGAATLLQASWLATTMRERSAFPGTSDHRG